MNIPEIWEAAEMTRILCRVTTFLRTDPLYSREEAANELEEFLGDHLLPIFESARNDAIGGGSDCLNYS